MQLRPQELLTSIGLLILRLGIGGYLLTHGWGKVQMLINRQFEMFGDPIGIGSQLSLILVVFAEFVCAILVMLGLMTRLACVPVVVTMIVAALVAHGKDPWTMQAAFELFMQGKSEFPVSKQPAMMFLFPFLAMIFTGPGRISIDALLPFSIHSFLPAQRSAAGFEVLTDSPRS